VISSRVVTLNRLTVRLLTIAVTSVAMFGLVLAGGIRQAWLASTLECATLLDEAELEGGLHGSIEGWRSQTDARGCRSTATDRDDREVASIAIARRSRCTVDGFGGMRVALEGIAAADVEVAERNGIWALALPIDAGGCIEMRLGDGALPVSRDDVRTLATAALARRATLREYIASLEPE
jgi:hypothetical protein